MSENPEFMYIEEDPTTDDVRRLLTEITEADVSEQSAQLFAKLAVMPPSLRLSYNASIICDILSVHGVENVLKNGLSIQERHALVELDVQGLTEESRKTARALLNVKERWIFTKTIGGLFNAARDNDDGYIDLEGLQSN